MRLTVLILSVFLGTAPLFAQNISYIIPEGYEKEISAEDYKRIVDLSVERISRRYAIDAVKGGSILLTKDQNTQMLNLHNLIVKCRVVADRNQWRRIIDEHFDKLFSSVDEQKKINLEDFESVKDYLSIRIYPKEVVAKRGGALNLVARTDLEGTYTLLMFDLPGSFVPVQRSIFERWEREMSEVFDTAQRHINLQKIVKMTQSYTIDTSDIEVTFIENDDYAASYALDLLRNSPESVGKWGAVIVIPNKGLVNICKISPEHPQDFIKFIQATKHVMDQFYAQHPQPVSRQYFWYYGGKFTKIQVGRDDKGNTQVTTPEALAALMGEN
jgi:hypothetical protein